MPVVQSKKRARGTFGSWCGFSIAYRLLSARAVRCRTMLSAALTSTSGTGQLFAEAEMSIKFGLVLAVALPPSLLCYLCSADVCNLKVVTDASPDYSDMESLVHSASAKWSTAEEKCWARFYWNHIGRRQTSPMVLHGMELTDPIRQFNDYGYTMCSTVSGINCATWHFMGLRSKFWDISLHTVPEVFYAERWHMYDNSMSALYTLCDGRTLAGVEDIGRAAGCEASGGRVEPGHVARYHCLYSTGPNGFLTGADTQR